MPLKEPDKVGNEWTWKQAVTWIGFDILDAPLDWGIYEQKIQSLLKQNITSVRTQARAAIRELIEAVYMGYISSIWHSQHIDFREDSFGPAGGHETEEIMMGRMRVFISIGGCPFAGLHFSKADILATWPGEPIEPDEKIINPPSDAPIRRGRRLGSGAYDDSKSLAMMETLITDGTYTSPWAAAGDECVQDLAKGNSFDSTRKRLHRNYRKITHTK